MEQPFEKCIYYVNIFSPMNIFSMIYDLEPINSESWRKMTDTFQADNSAHVASHISFIIGAKRHKYGFVCPPKTHSTAASLNDKCTAGIMSVIKKMPQQVEHVQLIWHLEPNYFSICSDYITWKIEIAVDSKLNGYDLLTHSSYFCQ